MYSLYRSITHLIAPVLPLWLERRRRHGKEDASRLAERFGHASCPRPQGQLLWVHAASVGEANAALPLIHEMLDAMPALNILLTTGTVTSAALMAGRLPPRALHQFIPVDAPAAVRRFMEHWRPDLGIFIDSELWPNLLMQARLHQVTMGLVNARMSESSFRAWSRFGAGLIRRLLASFRFCYAQSQNDADRLAQLGVNEITGIGNIKYDVPPLSCDNEELERLRAMLQARAVFLAASTHPGEEKLLAQLHEELKREIPSLLTVIVPRHAHRAGQVMQECGSLRISRRSQGQEITAQTDIYLADTMGELGLFYQLADVAFIGGSLVPHGGQNPIEALKLGCPVLFGPYMTNFQSVAEGLLTAKAALQVADKQELKSQVLRLLQHPQERKAMAEKGQEHVRVHSGSLAQVVQKLLQSLARQPRGV